MASNPVPYRHLRTKSGDLEKLEGNACFLRGDDVFFTVIFEYPNQSKFFIRFGLRENCQDNKPVDTN